MKPLAVVIEDDKHLSEVFAQTIEQAGYVVEIILDGQRAVEYLETQTPHFVLLDMNLPHVSGTKLLAQIRDDARLSNTHVVVATANPHMVTAEAAAQADFVLMKPVGFMQLFELAQRLYPPE